jgi:membrane-associated phospholipid phosphatase
MFADVMVALTKRPGTAFEAQLQRLSARIAENRMVAGLHFPIDGVAGQHLGAALATWFVIYAQDPKTTLNWVWTEAEQEMRELGFIV